MLRSHGGDKLIRLFDEIIADCHVPERWTVIEPVEGCTFESTLFMIEFDLLLALKEIGLPLGLPLALRALSDSDDGLHGVAIDAIKAIGPSATEAVPDLLKYIETNEPAGLSEDHFDYRRSLRRDACGGLAAIGSAKELSKLAKGKLPFDVREAAQKAFDEPGFDF